MSRLIHPTKLSCLARAFAALAISTACALTGLTRPASAQVSVTTAHNDNARTGQNLHETILTQANVTPARFGKLFTRNVDAKIWSQPLYVPKVAIPGKGTHNVVYVVTEHGGVYAFDADDPTQDQPLWKNQILPGPFDATWANQNVGCPVIDPVSNTLYIIFKNFEGNWVFRLFAVDIRTGKEIANSGQIVTATVAGTGKSSVNGQLTMSTSNQKNRPALLLANGMVYAAFGGSVNEYDPTISWNGWVFAFNAKTLAHVYTLCIAPNTNGGGIWQAANGLAADSSGNIYSSGGNGNGFGGQWSFDANTGGVDYGTSILKMGLIPATTSRNGSPVNNGQRLDVLDYFTPYNYQYVETNDQDLGCSGPLLIPGTNYLATGDKQHHMYIVNTANMGKWNSTSNSQIVRDFVAWGGHLHGGLTYYNSPNFGPLLYGWSEEDYLKAYRLADLLNPNITPAPITQTTYYDRPGMPGGFTSLSANGAQPNTGIIWANVPYLGDANLYTVPGIIRAFSAVDLTNELWNSRMLLSRDDIGLYSKYSFPTIANGKVYVASFSNGLHCFGLLPAAPIPAAPVNLTARAGLYDVNLAWPAVSGATCYSVLRSTTSGGPYTAVTNSDVTNSFTDTGVAIGTTYYYVVTADSSGGDSPNSNQVSAAPLTVSADSVISIKFDGGGNGTTTGPATTPMGTPEIAGVIPVAYWNNAAGTTGTLTNPVNNSGVASTASATWNCVNTAALSIPDTAGNNRLMRGFLSGNNTSSTTFSISNLPASFVTSGYDVYVYTDGINPTASRTGVFTIGSSTQSVVDEQNRDFDGQFIPAGVGQVGNYAVFPNLTSSSFQLTATPGASTDASPRAPLNAVEIVAHQSPGSPPSAPTGLTAAAGNGVVNLNWNPIAGASGYTVFRATVSGGPYTNIATSPSPTYADGTVVNGTTYYYVVQATVNGIQSANSNQATAKPVASERGRTIGIDFGGVTTNPMASTEVAGAPNVSAAHWNDEASNYGTSYGLVDDTGTGTTADVAWSADAVADTAISDVAGNNRMMRGYLAPDTTPASVNISNLPAPFVSKGYDVYIYIDGNNPSGTREGSYQIGNNTVTCTDAEGVDYSGTFVYGNNGTGNFICIPGLNSANFTLLATPLTTTDGVNGAPINGIQIVGHDNPPVPVSLTPMPQSTVAGSASTVAATYSDADGYKDMSVCLASVGSPTNAATSLGVAYYPGTNLLYLRTTSNTLVGGFTPGSNNVITTTLGSLNCAASSVTTSGNQIILNLSITPATGLEGVQPTYLDVTDSSNITSGWVGFGNWTITAPAGTTSAVKTTASTTHS